MTRIGYVIDILVIIGAAFVKLPQIIKINEHWSVDGVSFPMVLLEFISDAIACVYNVRMQYGLFSFFEKIILLVGNFVLLIFFVVVTIVPGYEHRYTYTYERTATWKCYLLSIVLCVVILPQFLHEKVVSDGGVEDMFKASIFIFVASRVFQIYTNFKMRMIENLSVVMFVLPILGSIARIITAIIDMDSDPIVIAGFSCSIVLNAIVIVQMRMFRQHHNGHVSLISEL